MDKGWVFFLILIVVSLAVEGFFSMMEMAAVSFNKVRLQYYLSKNHRRARWLSYLLNHPTRLFGTTLIGVNAALQFGSECARRFYISLGISPDYAPITQVILVLLFAELSPMFAARRYSEHVSMLGIPFLYLCSLVMTPIIWMLNWICQFFNWVFRIKGSPGLYLTRDELQKAITEGGEIKQQQQDLIVTNVFALKKKRAKDFMQPLDQIKCIPSNVTVAEMREAMELQYMPFFPVYHLSKKNIIAVAYPRDFLKYQDEEKIRPHLKTPWFISEKSHIHQIVQQFQKNNQTLAIVLDDHGNAEGILALDMIVEEIFGEREDWIAEEVDAFDRDLHVYIEKTYPGNFKVQELQEMYEIKLDENVDLTLDELMEKHLGHTPSLGEEIIIGKYRFKVVEDYLLGERKIGIKSLMK